MLLRWVFGDDATGPLFDVLAVGSLASSDDVRLRVAETIREVSFTEAGASSVVGCLYATEKLATLISDTKNPETQQLACTSLMQICARHKFARRRLFAYVDDEAKGKALGLGAAIEHRFPELHAMREDEAVAAVLAGLHEDNKKTGK